MDEIEDIMSSINDTYEDIQRIQVREDSLCILENTPRNVFFFEFIYQLYRQQYSPIYFEMSEWYNGNKLVSDYNLYKLFGLFGIMCMFSTKNTHK